MRFISGTIGGLLVAILGSFLVTITFANSPEKGGSWGVITFFVLWVLSILVSVRAASVGKAWRKLFITSSVLSFLAPISAIIFTGSYMASQGESGAKMAGAAIGGGLVSGFVGFVGFFLGVVFLIIGLLSGRDKQIVYVERPVQQ